jgi:hypothetical protein
MHSYRGRSTRRNLIVFSSKKGWLRSNLYLVKLSKLVYTKLVEVTSDRGHWADWIKMRIQKLEDSLTNHLGITVDPLSYTTIRPIRCAWFIIYDSIDD